jgi:ABC-type Fe3+ transport system substrate-binding protein
MEINMDKARAFLDYTQNDEGTQAREALYASIQDKVMAHIEAQKQQIAQTMLQPQETTQDED